MSTFTCPVVRVESVDNHPNADRLSIIKMEGLGYTAISAKLESGEPRYKVGDWVVYIPSAAVLPEWLLKNMGFWDDVSGKGTLAGSRGDRVKPLKLRGVFSEGVLFPVTYDDELASNGGGNVVAVPNPQDTLVEDLCQVELGQDVAAILDITKWEPPIPITMQGMVANMTGFTVRYDFERLQSVPDIFESDEPVVAYEKLHGTFTSIVFIPGLNHAEMFGSRGEIIVHSKGLGAQGLVFKNVPENAGNLYVRILNKLLVDGLEDRLRNLSNIHGGVRIAVLGETYGVGVQDLHYGTKEPQFRVFDLMIDRTFADMVNFEFAVAELLKLTLVPKLYEGLYDYRVLLAHSVGNTTLQGTNVREGIVIRHTREARHPMHGRKIAKLINEAYLTRKGNGTEYN